MPDPLSVIARLPRGLCGVVFRHDGAPERAALGAPWRALCRARRLALVVAGDARLAAALRAGVHLRAGRLAGPMRVPGLRTSSAHNMAQLIRARRAGAAVIFISPVFATASHPGAPGLGCFGWRRLARRAGAAKPFALGGISAEDCRALGRLCRGVPRLKRFCR